VAILIRDSVLYFLVMFAAYFTCLLVWACARSTLLEVPIAFSVAMSCCLGNRIVLNVRDVKRNAASAASAAGAAAGEPRPVKHVDQTRRMRSSVYTTQLTDVEMVQLRSMRSDVEEGHGQFIIAI